MKNSQQKKTDQIFATYFAHSSETDGGGATSKGEHSTGRAELLLLATTSEGEGSRLDVVAIFAGKVECWREFEGSLQAGRGRVFQGEGKEKRMFSIETFYGKITR